MGVAGQQRTDNEDPADNLLEDHRYSEEGEQYANRDVWQAFEIAVRVRASDLLSAVMLTADRKRIWLPGTDSNRRPSD